jgi:hypothetical protein
MNIKEIVSQLWRIDEKKFVEQDEFKSRVMGHRVFFQGTIETDVEACGGPFLYCLGEPDPEHSTHLWIAVTYGALPSPRVLRIGQVVRGIGVIEEFDYDSVELRVLQVSVLP